MTPDRDTIGWWAWVNQPAVSPSTRNARQHLVELWTMANGKTDPQDVIDEILAGNISPYDTGLALQSVVEGMAPGTKNQYLTMLGGEGKPRKGAGFLLSVLGNNFSVKKFSDLVPTGDATTLTEKKAPTVEELKHMLRSLANPRDRALLGIMACTGMRIGEVVSRKMSQIERRPDGHARIVLGATATKKKYKRAVFLTEEVVQWIDAYHTNGLKDNPWVFPGENYTDHLNKLPAYRAVKELFEKCGLKDNLEDRERPYIYSPHSFRKFAQSQMRACKLNEGIIDAIVGHTSATKRAYEDIEANEKEWLELCSEKMTWLTEKVVVTQRDPQQQKEIDQLKEKMAGMTDWYQALHDFLEKAGVVIEKTPDGKLQFLPRKALPQFYPQREEPKALPEKDIADEFQAFLEWKKKHSEDTSNPVMGA